MIINNINGNFINQRMSKAIIIVNAHVNEGKISPTAPVAEKMAMAMKQGIISSNQSITVEILGGADLWAKSVNLTSENDGVRYFPLTIKLPDWFNFSAKRVYKICSNLENRRKWVKQHFGYQTSSDNSLLGDLWLPIIFKPRKTIYADIIGEGEMPNSYQQLPSFPETSKNLVCTLASQLLESINATPAVYLLQFKIIKDNIIFDRLWPFPATPAIATINNKQQTDLFTHHWQCIYQ